MTKTIKIVGVIGITDDQETKSPGCVRLKIKKVRHINMSDPTSTYEKCCLGAATITDTNMELKSL